MTGHGFTSEVAQNKMLAAGLEGLANNEKSRSSPTQQRSPSLAGHSASNDNQLGKKVIQKKTHIYEQNLIVDIDFHNSFFTNIAINA